MGKIYTKLRIVGAGGQNHVNRCKAWLWCTHSLRIALVECKAVPPCGVALLQNGQGVPLGALTHRHCSSLKCPSVGVFFPSIRISRRGGVRW